jgi:myo-inositol-1(or 4)-monophosphatase
MPADSTSAEEVALAAMEGACRLLVAAQGWGRPALGEVVDKGVHEFQTFLDVSIEDRFRATLARAFPEDGFWGEESGFFPGQQGAACWFVDPLDGTSNFLNGRQEVAVSVARYLGDSPLFVCIALPMRGITLSLSHNGMQVKGAAEGLVGGRRAHKLCDGLVGLPSGKKGLDALWERGGPAQRLLQQSRGVRISGALVYELAQVALGELDFRYSLSSSAFDAAAGAALVVASGGCVSDIEGRPWSPDSGSIVAAGNREIHAEGLRLLRGAGSA